MSFPVPNHHVPDATLDRLDLITSLQWLYGFVERGEVVLVKAAKGAADHRPLPFFPVLFGENHQAAISKLADVVATITARGLTPYLKLNPYSAEKLEQFSGHPLPREWTGSSLVQIHGEPLARGTWSNRHLSRVAVVSGDHDTGREDDPDWRKVMPTSDGMAAFFNTAVDTGSVVPPTLMQTARGYSPVWVLEEPVPYSDDVEREIKAVTAELCFRLGDVTGSVDTSVYKNINPDIKAPGAIHPKTGAVTTFYLVNDGATYTLGQLKEHFDPANFWSTERLQRRRKRAGLPRRASGLSPSLTTSTSNHLAPSRAFVEDARKLVEAWDRDLSGKVNDFVMAFGWHLRKIMQAERLAGVTGDALDQAKKDLLHDLIEEVLAVLNACHHSTHLRKIKELVKMPYPPAPRSPVELADAWGVSEQMVKELGLRTIIPSYVHVDRQRLKRDRKEAEARNRQKRDHDLRNLALAGASLAEIDAAGYTADQMKKMKQKLKSEGVAYPRAKRSSRE